MRPVTSSSTGTDAGIVTEPPAYLIRVALPEELEELQRLRGEVYVAEGFLRPEDLRGGLDDSPDDARSVSVIGRDLATGDLVATVRLIFRNGSLLPIEDLYGLQLDATAPAELSRLVIRRDHRRGVLAIALGRMCYELTESAGVDYVFAIMERPLLRLMKALGFPFETIGEPTVTYNTLNWPTRLKTSELLESLHRTTPQLGEFFSGNAAGQRFQDVVVQG